jgi:hypothetical protein
LHLSADCGFLTPSASIVRAAAYALGISYVDEFSQIYQASWINQLRATTMGHLVLGSEFSWGDIIAYTIGVGLCCAIDVILFKIGRARKKP